MTMTSTQFTISAGEADGRIDKLLAERYSQERSRSYFQWLIDRGAVCLNGAPVKKQYRPQEGDLVEICWEELPQVELVAQEIPLSILFEDAAIIVIDKPAGLVVHPGAGNWRGTFANALLHHCQELWEADEPLRPGIVHRLDKETTGVLIAAKTRASHTKLVELFARREVKKEYLAVCHGNPGEGEIVAPIGRHPRNRKKMAVVKEGGKEATTSFSVIGSDGRVSLVRVEPLTGRTHQIRVHFAHRGTPIVGDALYGSTGGAKRQLLHAYRLSLPHPISGEGLVFEAPVPPDMRPFCAKYGLS